MNRSTFAHSKSGHVRISDPHCTSLLYFYYFLNFFSDLFLDPTIRTLTEMCLTDVMSGFGSLKFDDPIPGIDSFADFYTQLVDQFQAVSYGDKLFATFLMLPLTNVNIWKYRYSGDPNIGHLNIGII